MGTDTILRHGIKSTPGPWFGPNFNSVTAEPTRALTGKFKPKGKQTALSAYDLRVEITGDNVAADARLIAKAPQLLELLKECEESFTADDSYKMLRDAARKLIAEIEA
jgi:hypothetical protein